MDQLFIFTNELKLDLRKLRHFFSLSLLFSKLSITSFLFFSLSFILFPFIYFFIFLIFIYKYFAKYFFLFINIIFFAIFSDTITISYYDNFIYYFRLCFYDLWFIIIPLWIYKLLGYITKENINKSILKLLIFLDTKAFNLFIYLERKIPRLLYRFKKIIYKFIYYFFKYKAYITTVEGQHFIRRVYKSLRGRWLSYIFFMILRSLKNHKILVYIYFLHIISSIYTIKQKFVLAINLSINLSIYKFIKLMNLSIYIFMSLFYKLAEIIFGY